MVWLCLSLAQASERDDIAEHLHRTEVDLRLGTGALPAEAREARLDLLDALHRYHEAGRFPHNHDTPQGRPRPVPVPGGYDVPVDATPVFIDEHDTACAVGQLIRESGHQELAARIAAEGNLRYVAEIDDPELADWATAHGFTAAELARIQPTYRYAPSWVRPGRARAAIDLQRSSISSEAFRLSAVAMQNQVQSCVNAASPTSAEAVEVHQDCDGSRQCEVRVFGPPEAHDVLRCAGAGLGSGPREAGHAHVFVVLDADGALPQQTWAPEDPPPQGGAPAFDLEPLSAMVGPPRTATLPELLEPRLELWVDVEHLERDLRADPYRSRGSVRGLEPLERCVRVTGMTPMEGTLVMTWGDHGNTARLDLDGAPPLVRHCVDRTEGLWGASALSMTLTAPIRVTLPGQGPPGWWRPADGSRPELPPLEAP